MNSSLPVTGIAFAGTRCIARGPLAELAQAAKRAFDQSPDISVLIFDAVSSEPIDLNFEGSEAEVLARLAAPEEIVPAARRQAGRPRLGVLAKEITLLPRHWDWLSAQNGGASVALRKLVEHAMRSHEFADQARRVRDATYRFMHAIGGNLAGFEAASRALFAHDRPGFVQAIVDWPVDIRRHTTDLAMPWFESAAATNASGG